MFRTEILSGFYLEGNDTEGRRKLVGALFVFLGLASIVEVGALFFVQSRLSPLLFGSGYRSEWFVLGILFFLLSGFQQLPLMVLRTAQDARRSTIWSLRVFLINAAGVVLFVVVLHRGLTGMLIAYCIGYGSMMVVQFASFGPYVRLNFEFRRLAPLFAFGLPMLPNMAARNVLETANRYILPHYHGLPELATLTMAAKIAGIVNSLLLVPFAFACLPFVYARAHDADSPKLFGRLTYYIAIILCLLFLFIEATKTWLLNVLGGAQYADAAPVITIMMIGIVFSGLQNMVAAGVHITKKIPQEAAIMVGASLVSVIANFLLIPHFKSAGAAGATTIGFFCFLIGTFVLAQRYFPIPYPYRKIILTFTGAAACWWVMGFFDNTLTRVVPVILYVVALVILDRTLLREGRALVQQIVASVRDKTKGAKPSQIPLDTDERS
jgi:O-antigen/teichoic acid export membrane protein